ncbi:MAG: trehalase-like domain-containing protein, partial [Myxococcota bacterium]
MSMGLYQGLIGNGFCSALIEPNTNISWLCWPRYDSSFVFGSLLDTERGGQFQIKSLKPATTQQHYIPHTTALRTEFSSSEGRFEVLDFAPFSESMEECAYPRQLIRILRPLEGKPRFRWVCEPTYDYARTTITSSWFEAKNQIRFNGFPQYVTLDANIALSHASRQTDTMLEQDVVFVLTWSEQPFACTDIEAYALQQPLTAGRLLLRYLA